MFFTDLFVIHLIMRFAIFFAEWLNLYYFQKEK